MIRIFKLNLAIWLLAFSSLAQAAGGLKIISYYEIILSEFFGLSGATMAEWMPVVGACLTFTLILLVGFSYRAALAKTQGSLVPDGGFSVKSVVEALLEFVIDLGTGVIGEKNVRPFLPLLTGLFCFIFISNLTGLVPGFLPATDSLNTNLAMGITVFLVYNYAGIKEHGAAYIKQFLGPVLFLMPLMVVIEVIGHVARPISLSLRLYGNIFGDHLVLSVFTSLTVLVFPAMFLFFGLMVASLQSFVFTLLTSIYISMAMSHDH